MKKLSLIFVFSLFILSSIVAQAPLKTAVCDFSYKFISGDGTNASGVVWHPGTKQYYTFIAGNSTFPFESFNTEGKNLYSGMVGFDGRGFWYNPKTKSLEANCAGDEGWVKIKLDSNNTHSSSIIKEAVFQPEFNSCGTYCPEKKAVVFLNLEAGTFDFYNYKKPSKISAVNAGIPSLELYDFNSSTISYTGKEGFELVLLNVEKGCITFFNLNGEKTAETVLPSLAPIPDLFRFAFANDRVFLYDADERTWMAYKVF